jgi:hypothetical protein
MSDAWYCVCDAAGECRSIGTVVASQLPSGWSAVALTDADAEALLSGAAAWSPAARAVVPLPVPVPEAVTPWQLQTWLLRERAITPAAVSGLISSLPAEIRAQAEIDWTRAAMVRRAHPLIDTLGAALGLLPAEIDDAFRQAADLVS